MFWDKISPLYDLFENVYNHKVYAGTGKRVADFIESTDEVLECACGTGAISFYIAQNCKRLVATDFSSGMLKQAFRKCRAYENVSFKKADITNIKCRDSRFDKVVAGNVIHLLPDPGKALAELWRVVKPGGKIIIPTYINMSKESAGLAVKFVEFLGADFKQQFDLDSYKSFFENLGYQGVEYAVVDGRMPCAIAIITKEKAEGKIQNGMSEKVGSEPDRIQSAYHDSKNIYDDVLTQGSFLSRLYIRFFWSGTDDNEIARKILAYVPDDFEGTMLDVPVGTAVFTENKWRRLSKASITCLDYSVDMLEKAKKRLEDCKHISFIQGDVGNLPLADDSQDIVMSMNGFHAFPDKKKAFKETFRVLKKGGIFVACFYIKGKSKRTDWLVKNILSKKGWFTPPFPTEEQLLCILRKLYPEVEYHVDGSMVYFKCVK